MHWPDSFQANRWIRTLNLLLQAVLFLTLFAGINYLALRHTSRFDLTRYRSFSLSPETHAYLGQLAEPVRVIVAFDRNSKSEATLRARSDVLGLLREYDFATRRDGASRIRIEDIDPLLQRTTAVNLGIEKNNVVVFISADEKRRRVVGENDLYLAENGERRAFLGEKLFTAAILELANPQQKVLYFLTGHEEMDPGSMDETRGLSLLYTELRIRNFAVETLDLSRVRRVPENAALVIGIAPRTPFLPAEQELLREYLAGTGRLLLAMAPVMEPSHADTGLGQLFRDWGIQVADCLVVDPDPAAHAEGGDLMLGVFVKHPITLALGNRVQTGNTRVVRRDLAGPTDVTLTVTGLIAAGDKAWGETAFRLGGRPNADSTDFRGNPKLFVAAVSERVTATNLPFSVRGGRLLVFGTADCFANNRLGYGGNHTLAISAVNWAVDRDTQTNIQPRPLEKFQLTLSETELVRLRLGLLLILPGTVGLLGLVVYWSRRS